MKVSKGVITKGFVFSGIINIGGALIFSRFFTNEFIPKNDPVVMSNFGLLMIVVWGVSIFIYFSKIRAIKLAGGSVCNRKIHLWI